MEKESFIYSILSTTFSSPGTLKRLTYSILSFFSELLRFQQLANSLWYYQSMIKLYYKYSLSKHQFPLNSVIFYFRFAFLPHEWTNAKQRSDQCPSWKNGESLCLPFYVQKKWLWAFSVSDFFCRCKLLLMKAKARINCWLIICSSNDTKAPKLKYIFSSTRFRFWIKIHSVLLADAWQPYLKKK